MTVCRLEDQANFMSEWACAFLINNHPVGLFDILSVSILLLVVTWVVSMFFSSRVLRVIVRSLAIAFALCGVPVPLPFFYPIFVPILLPAWPYLFVEKVYELPEYFAPRTFLLILVVSLIVLGLVEWRRKRGKEAAKERRRGT